MISFVFRYWSQILATMSLLISLYLMIKNRKQLIVVKDNPFDPFVKDGSLYAMFEDGSKISLGDGYIVSFTILNSSPNDISYFDLVANDSETNFRQSLLTSKSLEPIVGNVNNLKVFSETELGPFSLTFPESNSGVFKANSFTRLDLCIVPISDDYSGYIDVSFKVTIRSFFHTSKHSSVKKRKWFRAYSQRIDATNWKKRPKANTEKLQS